MRGQSIVKRGSHLAVADLARDERVVYDVVLLAGSPRRYTLSLAPGLAEGYVIDVDGGQWAVADVRPVEGAAPQLICIHTA